MFGKSFFRLTVQHLLNKPTLRLCCLSSCSPRPSCSLSSPVLLLRRIDDVALGGNFTAQWKCGSRPTVLQRQWALQNVRLYSSQPTDPIEEIHIKELQDVVHKNECQIIDVREPEELKQTGRIGQPINIPVGEIGDALQMSDEVFHSKYGFKKPDSSDTDIIFYCRAGVRSKRALDTAHALGYYKARHFPGGWVEWATVNGLPQ